MFWPPGLQHLPDSITLGLLTEPGLCARLGSGPRLQSFLWWEGRNEEGAAGNMGPGFGNEGPRQPLPASHYHRRPQRPRDAVPLGEISICSTHEGGMSKLLSSSSLPCWERWGWVGSSDQDWAF